MSDNYDNNDDFDDIFEKIKKYFSLNTDMVDIDFLFLPESSLDQNFQPKTKDIKGFKVSYHFEPGMDKPDIKVEGDFDMKKIQDYFKTLNRSDYKRIRKFKNSQDKNIIDASNLLIGPSEQDNTSNIIEPFTEVYPYDKNVEIIIELPGMEKGHIILSIGEDEKSLKISADNGTRRYLKQIELPFKSSMKNHKIEINNGIASITIRKKD